MSIFFSWDLVAGLGFKAFHAFMARKVNILDFERFEEGGTNIEPALVNLVLCA